MARVTSLRPQVSVIIPAFGAPSPVVDAVRALLAIPLHLDVTVVDNDPEQGIGTLLPDAPRLRLMEPGRNTGFAGAINLGIAASAGEFVLFHNADLALGSGYVEALLAFMRSHPNAGAVSGKIVRATGAETPTAIDSAGIVMRRDRGAHDRAEGAPDDGTLACDQEVFAVSGAALFARRSALEDVAIEGEVLDESFFMYKEDLDLCWRLRLRGWECWYVAGAVASHVRTSRGVGGRGYARSFRRYLSNERTKARHVRVHSLKNEILLLLKDDSLVSVLRDLPWILVRQAGVVAVTAVVAPSALVEAFRLLGRAVPGALRKRGVVQQRAIVPPSEIRRGWFGG